jgi:hypothetical protein
MSLSFRADGDQAFLYGYYHCLSASIGIELAEYRGYMVFDSLLTDIQYIGNLLIEVALSHIT